MKKRIDVLLVERGLVPTRQRAQAVILAGKVLVDDQPVDKPGHSVPEEAAIRLREADHPYVSRGALKLAAALDSFGVNAEARVGLDVGASTGGFTQLLLERGASKIFALDVGHNQMDWKIRQDPRVIVQEGVNARYLTFEAIGQRVDIIVIDVSFISLEKILPALLQFSKPETDWISLIKPQFEVGRERVGKGGIVNSEEDRMEAVARLTRFAETIGLSRRALIESPITGTHGNREYLAHWKQCFGEGDTSVGTDGPVG